MCGALMLHSVLDVVTLKLMLGLYVMPMDLNGKLPVDQLQIGPGYLWIGCRGSTLNMAKPGPEHLLVNCKHIFEQDE